MTTEAENDSKALSESIREQRKLFDKYFEPLRSSLWSFCYRLTGSLWEAEDLVQDTLLKGFAGLARHWSPVAPKAYMFRIAARTWLDIRDKDRLDLVSLEAAPEPAADAADSLSMSEAMLQLVQALPPRQRVVLLLTQAFEFSAADVAEMLSMTEGAVKAALHRARRGLEEAMPPRSSPSEAETRLANLVAEAFNRRDLDALCRLLQEDVVVDIVGVAEEKGLEAVKKSSLHYTIEDEDANEAVVAILENEAVVLLLKHLDNGEKAISEVITLAERQGLVDKLRSYYFCPDLTTTAAGQLGMRAHTHGHHGS